MTAEQNEERYQDGKPEHGKHFLWSDNGRGFRISDELKYLYVCNFNLSRSKPKEKLFFCSSPKLITGNSTIEGRAA